MSVDEPLFHMKHLIEKHTSLYLHVYISGLLWTKYSQYYYHGFNVIGNDFVTSSHIFFGHPVATICPSHTYIVQVTNATTLEDERITSFLERLQEPEVEISGTSLLLIKPSLLILARIRQVTVCR